MGADSPGEPEVRSRTPRARTAQAGYVFLHTVWFSLSSTHQSSVLPSEGPFHLCLGPCLACEAPSSPSCMTTPGAHPLPQPYSCNSASSEILILASTFLVCKTFCANVLWTFLLILFHGYIDRFFELASAVVAVMVSVF